MSQKVEVLLVDDIDGSDAAETVRFGLDGAQYEIDLNGVHSGELRKTITRYARHARKVTARSGRPSLPRTGPADGRTAKIRDWAREQGIEVKDRGRVPADVAAAYEAANGK